MSIRYGRSLPNGPRPKPPQPKLGEVGPARDLIRIQRKQKKKKQATKAQSSTSNGSQPPNTDAQQQAATKKKKKAKPERSKQNTPVRVEVVRPARASSPDGSNGLVRSNRVVVEWRTDGRRYLAWGRQGVKKVHGWRECTNNTTYQQLLRKLHPIGTRLNIADTRVPVVEILDLIIATGKILKPRPGTTVQPSRPKPLASQQLQRRSRSGARPNQVIRQRRSAAAEAARNEVLVTRPSDGKPSKAARRRKATSEEAHRVHKRKQLLAQQRKELRRLSWLRRHGYEARQAPRDMMDVALQGGSPGLKR
jgi:hypothetical protein